MRNIKVVEIDYFIMETKYSIAHTIANQIDSATSTHIIMAINTPADFDFNILVK
jgi:hypothetical protein